MVRAVMFYISLQTRTRLHVGVYVGLSLCVCVCILYGHVLLQIHKLNFKESSAFTQHWKLTDFFWL